MNITLNGLNNPSNIITLSDCPTILTISNGGTGDYASGYINIGSLNSVILGTEYYIEVNGERILSTNDISKSVGKRFYISNQSSVTNQLAVANKIIAALRNISTVDANYNIYQYYADNVLKASVILKAKEIGSKYNLTIKTNLPTGVITIGTTNGSNTDTLASGKSNKINIDIYSNQGASQPRINSNYPTIGNYVTTLEKEYFSKSVSFDLSPLLTTLIDYNNTTQYSIIIYSVIDANVTTIGSINNNYVTSGYLVNQGGTFLPKFTGSILAQNVKRGEPKPVYNNTILYTYEPTIVFSLYSDATVSNMNVVVDYKDSAYGTMTSQTIALFQNNNLQTFTLNLNVVNFNKSDYIDVTIPNVGVLRYKVIKPINATETNNRIYYNNSYGGVSFFDFTGDRTETRKTSIDYYQKQLFDFYNESKSELNKIYDKTVDITVTLKTHNLEKDGTWQLYDLQNSTNAWIEINGKTYTINITDVKIDKTTVNEIYVGTISYTYSLADSF